MLLKLLTEFFANRDERGSSEQQAFEFLRSNAGAVIRVPAMLVIERLAKERQVARSVQRDPSVATVSRLSLHLSEPKRTISKIFQKQSGRKLNDFRTLREAGLACRHPRAIRLRMRVTV